jgi:hypothetical protein
MVVIPECREADSSGIRMRSGSWSLAR